MSRAKDLHTILTELKDFGGRNLGAPVGKVLSAYAGKTGLGHSLADFMSIYLRSVDAAIDEALSCGQLSHERREKIVSKIQRARNLVSLEMHKSWQEAATAFVSDDFLDLLELVDDTVTVGGVSDPFDKEKAEEYFNEVKSIFDGIIESDLSNSVKAPILGNLQRLMTIFSTLERSGPLDADLRIKALLGDLVMHGEVISSSSEEAKNALMPLLKFVQSNYPSFKWTVDHLMTSANVALLAVQSGAI